MFRGSYCIDGTPPLSASRLGRIWATILRGLMIMDSARGFPLSWQFFGRLETIMSKKAVRCFNFVFSALVVSPFGMTFFDRETLGASTSGACPGTRQYLPKLRHSFTLQILFCILLFF